VNNVFERTYGNFGNYFIMIEFECILYSCNAYSDSIVGHIVVVLWDILLQYSSLWIWKATSGVDHSWQGCSKESQVIDILHCFLHWVSSRARRSSVLVLRLSWKWIGRGVKMSKIDSLIIHIRINDSLMIETMFIAYIYYAVVLCIFISLFCWFPEMQSTIICCYIWQYRGYLFNISKRWRVWLELYLSLFKSKGAHCSFYLIIFHLI